MKRPVAGVAGEAAGEREQAAADGACGADGAVGEAEQAGPAQQVVGEAGDHRPGGVGVELTRREVLERLILQVADAELDDGVLAVLGLDQRDLLVAVGRERVVLPDGEQLGLDTKDADAANDQPAGPENRLGDLRLPVVAAGSEPVWHLYVIRTSHREELATFLRDSRISTGVHYPDPPHLVAPYAHLGYGRGSFPVAEALAEEVLSLPIFPGMTEEQVTTVAAAVGAFFQRG